MSATEDKAINLNNTRKITEFTDHHDSISLDISSDNSKVVSGSGRNIKIWDVDSGEILTEYPLDGSHKWVRTLAFSNDSSMVASGFDSSDYVTLWDAETGDLITNFLEHDDNVNSVSFSSDDKMVVSGDENSVIVWEYAK